MFNRISYVPNFAITEDMEKNLQYEPEQSSHSLTQRIQSVFEKVDHLKYKYTTPLQRNLFRVSLAGGLSAAGGMIAGAENIVAALGFGAVILGSVIGGIGNGVSTWLAWETNTEDRLTLVEKDQKLILKNILQLNKWALDNQLLNQEELMQLVNSKMKETGTLDEIAIAMPILKS